MLTHCRVATFTEGRWRIGHERAWATRSYDPRRGSFFFHFRQARADGTFSMRSQAGFVVNLFLCVGLLLNFFSFASDWRLIGPEGGNVRSLAYDPSDPDRILLGTSAGQLFISKDEIGRASCRKRV